MPALDLHPKRTRVALSVTRPGVVLSALRKLSAAAGLAAALAAPALAQEIRVGVTTAVTGQVAANVNEVLDGANLYLDWVNSRGGVQGRKIALEIMDDVFDPKKAGENARVLIEERNVDVMFLSRGTPHTQAIIPHLEKNRVAIVGPSTGAMNFYTPVNPWVFMTRGTYQAEAAEIVRHFASIGASRIAVVHVDDSFGKDGMIGAQKGFDDTKLKPVSILTYDRAKPEFSAVIPALRAARADVVVVFGSGTAIVDLLKQARAAGIQAQFATMSNNASTGFIKALGKDGVGTVVSQVFPNERNESTELVREARRLSMAAKKGTLTPAMMEGYAAAKVLVEGLRRAKPLTREGIRNGLESIQGFNLGGPIVSYSATDHTGVEFVEMSIVSRSGTFMR
jgi:branched-chain amino acid transport system substrate-binding protein